MASQGNADATRAFADAVLVFDEAGVVGKWGSPAPPLPDELARHKLLDLVGDFSLYGGPPQGMIRAVRPGHTATHRIIAEAISLGILRPWEVPPLRVFPRGSEGGTLR